MAVEQKDLSCVRLPEAHAFSPIIYLETPGSRHVTYCLAPFLSPEVYGWTLAGILVKDGTYMQIAPMPGKLIVERLSPPTATEAGILLPPTMPIHEALQRGVVLALGDIKEPGIKEGDTVVFPFRAGEEFVCDGHKVLLMDYDMIRAVEEPVA